MAGNFYWANDERLVIELVDQVGDLSVPVSRGEIYAVDANGRNGTLIFGYRAGEFQTGTHIRKRESERAWAFVLSTLADDDRHVLIEMKPMSERRTDQFIQVYKLDVYTGLKTLVTTSPIPEASFLVDERGQPRIASGVDEGFERKFFYRDPRGPWRELTTVKGFTQHSFPVGFSSKERSAYVAEPGKGRFDLQAIDVETGARRLVASNEEAPPLGFITDRLSGQIVGVEYEPDVPTYEFLIPDHPLSQIIQGLLATYPDEHVRLLSATRDQKKGIVKVYSDRNPGIFMLVDLETRSARILMEARPWIHSERMAKMSAFHINASDGLRIHGYYTLPLHSALGSPPPLVVLPHGGPQVRDHWTFNPMVQFLAGEGFAVLQVNYRGSGGYGLKYEESGYRKWGDRVIEDIIDATRWMLRKDLADPKRTCIFGGSFGGYAALQAPILAPDLFRCSVGYAGVYDLTLLSEKGDIAETPLSRAYVRKAVGQDLATLKAGSPVYNAEKIKARVLLVHGQQDERAPIDHAERLRKSLTRAGKSVEWLVESKEGHGFYDEAARGRMYTRLLNFLKQNTSVSQPTPGQPAQ
jgi:dienelactone hydrolase